MDEPVRESIIIASPSEMSIRVDSQDGSGYQSREKLKVSGAVMCLASPVWKAMFACGGGFREAKRDGSQGTVVLFSDDDPKALHILLNIAHLNFHELPDIIKYKYLLQVSVLCDEYDIVRLLRPLAARSTEPLKPFVCKLEYDEWLFIAWAPGDKETYTEASKHLMLNTVSNADGHLLGCLGKKVGNTMPLGALGKNTFRGERCVVGYQCKLKGSIRASRLACFERNVRSRLSVGRVLLRKRQ